MNYTKPEVIVLGTAAEMIHGTLIKGSIGIIETVHWCILPAYELGE